MTNGRPHKLLVSITEIARFLSFCIRTPSHALSTAPQRRNIMDP